MAFSLAGNFQNLLGQIDFNPSDNVLLQEGATNIYSTTVNLPEGIYGLYVLQLKYNQ